MFISLLLAPLITIAAEPSPAFERLLEARPEQAEELQVVRSLALKLARKKISAAEFANTISQVTNEPFRIDLEMSSNFSLSLHLKTLNESDAFSFCFDFRDLNDDPDFRPRIIVVRWRMPDYYTQYSLDMTFEGELLSASFSGGSPSGTKVYTDFYDAEGSQLWREFHKDPVPLSLHEIYGREVEFAEGPLVSVIDMGIDYNHPALARQVFRETLATGEIRIGFDGKDRDLLSFDLAHPDSGPDHGTAVASVIAGYSSEIRLFPVRYSDDSEISEEVAEGYQRGSRIFNISSSFDEEFSSDSVELKRSLLASADKYTDALFILAAGNSGNNLDTFKSFEDARRPNIIYVASATKENQLYLPPDFESDDLYGFTCYGEKTVDFAHYGVQIRVATPGGLYSVVDGTSFAAPQVSGMAARLLIENPKLTGPELAEILRASVDSIDSMKGKLIYPGIPNLARALALAQKAQL